MDQHDAKIIKLIDDVIVMYATIAASLETLVLVDLYLPGQPTHMHCYAIERGPALLDQLDRDRAQVLIDGTPSQRGQFAHVASRIAKALRSINNGMKASVKEAQRSLDNSLN